MLRMLQQDMLVCIYKSFSNAGQSGCEGEPASMYRLFSRCNLSAVVLNQHDTCWHTAVR